MFNLPRTLPRPCLQHSWALPLGLSWRLALPRRWGLLPQWFQVRPGTRSGMVVGLAANSCQRCTINTLLNIEMGCRSYLQTESDVNVFESFSIREWSGAKPEVGLEHGESVIGVHEVRGKTSCPCRHVVDLGVLGDGRQERRTYVNNWKNILNSILTLLRLDLVHEVFIVFLFVFAVFRFLVCVVPNSSSLWKNVRCVVHPVSKRGIG